MDNKKGLQAALQDLDRMLKIYDMSVVDQSYELAEYTGEDWYKWSSVYDTKCGVEHELIAAARAVLAACDGGQNEG